MATSETVRALLEYVESGRSASAEIEAAAAEIGARRLRLVGIEILSWLKYQARARKPSPLALEEGVEWCRDLVALAEKQGFLRDVIAVARWSAAIRADVGEAERQELLSKVNEGYRPRLMT